MARAGVHNVQDAFVFGWRTFFGVCLLGSLEGGDTECGHAVAGRDACLAEFQGRYTVTGPSQWSRIHFDQRSFNNSHQRCTRYHSRYNHSC
jgi:hypothetical protein